MENEHEIGRKIQGGMVAYDFAPIFASWADALISGRLRTRPGKAAVQKVRAIYDKQGSAPSSFLRSTRKRRTWYVIRPRIYSATPARHLVASSTPSQANETPTATKVKKIVMLGLKIYHITHLQSCSLSELPSQGEGTDLHRP